jgi:Na+-transporting methylmalonyl-CoA/oxaloacetate decarboxylase gamma subunit
MMDQLIYDFVRDATTIQKGVFLMVAGISFVFLVQVIFFAVVKIWPRSKTE